MQEPKYPFLLVHGMGFRDGSLFNYWGRIPRQLKKMGCDIYYGTQDSNASVETNGKHIADRIQKIIEKTGAEKINIIAHSKGGLDARYAISTCGMGKYVASLTTISTPHHGSNTVDTLMKLPNPLVRFAGKCTDIVFRFIGDMKPDSYKVFQLFTTEMMENFNRENPDVEGVYYQSYAFVMHSPFSDMFLFVPSLIVWCIEGPNDGLLTPDAVRWGNFKGIYKSNIQRGISHCDEVDMRRKRFTKKKGEGVSDIVELYMDIVTGLKELGM